MSSARKRGKRSAQRTPASPSIRSPQAKALAHPLFRQRVKINRKALLTRKETRAKVRVINEEDI